MIEITGYTTEIGTHSYPVFTMITNEDGSNNVIPNYSNILISENKKYINDCIDNSYPISRLDTFKYKFQLFDIFEEPNKIWDYSYSRCVLADNEYILVLHALYAEFIEIVSDELKEIITFNNELKIDLNDSFSSSRNNYTQGRYKSIWYLLTNIVSKNSNSILQLKIDLLDVISSTVVARLLPICGANSIQLYDAINYARKKITLKTAYAIDKFCARLKEYYIPSMYCGMFMDSDGETYITPRAFNISDDNELEFIYHVDRDEKCLEKIPVEDFEFPG